MDRELVSKTRLLEILNARLQESNDCKECKVGGPILRRREIAADGSNWTPVDLKLSCGPGGSHKTCLPSLQRVAAEVAGQYNLEP